MQRDTPSGSGSGASGASGASSVQPQEIAGAPESTGLVFINSVAWAEIEKRYGKLTAHGFIEPTIIRTARKRHVCRECGGMIFPNDHYAEYLGESAGYQSGQRYHLGACADKQLRPKELGPRN